MKEKVKRILKKYQHRANALIFYPSLSTNSLKKCMEVRVENLFVEIGA